MTAPSNIDPAHFLSEHLEQASPDLLQVDRPRFSGHAM
jgi:hypothetical protein